MKSDATRAKALELFRDILAENGKGAPVTIHLQRLIEQYGGRDAQKALGACIQEYRGAAPLAQVPAGEESAPAYAEGHTPRFAVVGEKTPPQRAVAGPLPQPAQPQPNTAAPQNVVPPVAGESNAAQIEVLTAADLARIAELGSVRDIAKEFGRARLVAYLAEKEIDFPETARDTQIAGFVLESLKK